MYWDPFDELERLHHEMNRIFLGDRRLLEGPKDAVARSPVADLQETDKSVIATFEIPGVDKDGIELNVTDDSIEVKATRKFEKEQQSEKGAQYHMMSQSFYRRMALPADVDAGHATAVHKDGVLNVVMPKKDGEHKARKIEIE